MKKLNNQYAIHIKRVGIDAKTICGLDASKVAWTFENKMATCQKCSLKINENS